jgi:RNA polymerase sigma-70 factor (ECF subfamily)
METQADILLVDRVLQGEESAFESLVIKYQATLRALATNMLGDRDEARDVAQETFLQAYSGLSRFDRARNFKTWLLAIGVKRCLDRLRRKKTSWKYFHQETQERNPGLVKPARSIEESEIFYPLLKKLNQKERTAVSLWVNEDFQAREIGAVIGCSEATARVHLFNARKKLKKGLGESKNEVTP